ncbi:MAG: hypothetical protein LC131_06045 [Anaerolineae bacterium]|nr:hypothetical protein [Anaerolineae bacterium]HNS39440.1 hypothetical protein [Promineifilum sp.]
MKITTPKGYVIELTAEEAEELFPGLMRGVRRQMMGLSAETAAGAEPVPEARLLRRVLKRHRIPPTQRALYKALYEAGEEGMDFVTLAATTGRSTEELSGVLGGLGRRVNATPGIESLPEPPGVNLLFDYKESAPPLGGWGWAMRPAFREALEEVGLVWE